MTQATVTIEHGFYGKNEITNRTFPLSKAYDASKGYVEVFVGADDALRGVSSPRKARVKVTGPEQLTYAGDVSVPVLNPEHVASPIQEFLNNETEEEALARMQQSFDHLDYFADAAIEGIISGLIVVGPPGIGKSYGVEKKLREATLFNEIEGGSEKFEIVKGAISPGMLYRKLYKHSGRDHVLVLDDADIEDEEALNLLKAALDSCDKRIISWFKDAKWLEKEDIPEQFEFKGSIIFLTNIDFANARGKKAIHLNAIVSRCHYMDLEIGSTRDRLLRIKQVVVNGNMLQDYGFTKIEEKEIVDFIWENKDRMRELSLRLVKKLADLVQAAKRRPNAKVGWKDLAVTSLMKPSARYELLMESKGL